MLALDVALRRTMAFATNLSERWLNAHLPLSCGACSAPRGQQQDGTFPKSCSNPASLTS